MHFNANWHEHVANDLFDVEFGVCVLVETSVVQNGQLPLETENMCVFSLFILTLTESIPASFTGKIKIKTFVPF